MSAVEQEHETTRSHALRVEPLLQLAYGAKEGAVRFSSDGSRLAIAGGHSVHVVCVEDGAIVRTFEHRRRVRAVALSSAGWHVIIGGFDKQLCVHALDDGSRLFSYNADVGATVYAIAVTSSTEATLGTNAAGTTTTHSHASGAHFPTPGAPTSSPLETCRGQRSSCSAPRASLPSCRDASVRAKMKLKSPSAEGGAAADGRDSSSKDADLVAVGGESQGGTGYVHVHNCESGERVAGAIPNTSFCPTPFPLACSARGPTWTPRPCTLSQPHLHPCHRCAAGRGQSPCMR